MMLLNIIAPFKSYALELRNSIDQCVKKLHPLPALQVKFSKYW